MIAEKIAQIKAQLPVGVELVAVSKLKPTTDIMQAYDAGQRLFGENYATELRDKAAALPTDIKWHFIGHLQSKQLKYYIQHTALIQGVDTIEHLQAVAAAATKVGRVADVLLQAHVAQEETKFGFAVSEIEQMAHVAMPNGVRVCGIMAMASHTSDVARIRADFRTARRIFEQLKTNAFAGQECFNCLSMGMSHDWRIAVDEGSTMVRIGSEIFGLRPPKINI